MQSNREAKREDRNDTTGTAKHGREANDRLSHCQPDRATSLPLELKVQVRAHDIAQQALERRLYIKPPRSD